MHGLVSIVSAFTSSALAGFVFYMMTGRWVLGILVSISIFTGYLSITSYIAGAIGVAANFIVETLGKGK